jgi:DNA-binding response OmpR family regulator
MPTLHRKSDKVVLLVEDDPSVLDLYAIGLEHHGFRVVKAGTAAAALQRARDLGRIDILVTDVVLPGRPEAITIHGIDLMRRLLELQPDLKVILFSGQSKDRIEQVGGIPSGTIFLEKPVSLETLVRSIKLLLEA